MCVSMHMHPCVHNAFFVVFLVVQEASDSNLADPPAKRPRTASTAAEVDGEGQVVECLKDRADSARKRYLARRKAGLS